jgi:hypothetical protein
MSDALIYRGFFMTTDDSQAVQIDIEDLSQRIGIPERPIYCRYANGCKSANDKYY